MFNYIKFYTGIVNRFSFNRIILNNYDNYAWIQQFLYILFNIGINSNINKIIFKKLVIIKNVKKEKFRNFKTQKSEELSFSKREFPNK